MASIFDHIANWQGSASSDRVFRFCRLLCRAYEKAEPSQRAELRKAVAANSDVKRSLLDCFDMPDNRSFLLEAARRSEETGDHTGYLRSALLAISLTDGYDDSRDTLMWLAELWREVEDKGVDPEPHYRQIGEISSTEAVHMIGGPTALMILQMLDASRRDQLTWR